MNARRIVTLGTVAAVAVIAAVVSYSHMQELAAYHGESWRSYLIPLSVDGLVLAASMTLIGRPRRLVLAWCALAAGVTASLLANMADARPEVIAVLIAGWPAAAFAVAFKLLLQQLSADVPEVASTELPLELSDLPSPSQASQPAQTPSPITTPLSEVKQSPTSPAALSLALSAAPPASERPSQEQPAAARRVTVADVAPIAHLPRDEIARQLGVSVATVDRRLRDLRVSA
jgi:hypothetical protein